MVQDVWQAGFQQRLSGLMNNDPEVRDRAPNQDVAAAARQPGQSLAQVVEAIMQGYADRDAVTERAITITSAGSRQRSTDCVTLSYRTLWANARAVASAWQHAPAGPRAGDMLCSVGNGSNSYATLELACIASGVVSVPLIVNAAAQWHGILGETRPAALAVDVDFLDAIVPAILASEARPTSVYVLDYHDGDRAARHSYRRATARLHAAGIEVEPFQDLIAHGATLPQSPLPQPRLPQPAPDVAALAQIIYTSGATGAPKGAMFTTAHLAAMWIGQAQAIMPTIVTHYMPMSHVAGRMVLTGALARGGTCHFSTGNDPARMWDDIARSRPTEFFLIPRVCEMIFDRYQRMVATLVADGKNPTGAEDIAKTRLREELLGGRIVSAVNGSAPLDVDLHAFMESMLEVPVHDAYGSTEAGGVVLFDNKIQRPPVLEYKLVDVPELGYHKTDLPYPRGELLLKTASMIPGYHNRPELNAEIFDGDGYYRTGDIMAETGPDELKFVERKNNVLKLSQAEFVAVSTLEAIYGASPDIHQIFIYGRSGRASLLAVIVPNPADLQNHDESELRALLARSLQQAARAKGLHPYEIPRDFIIEPEPFTVANGLLSGVAKPLRPKLLQRYAEPLERLYENVGATREAELADLRRSVASQPVLETVQRAATALLGGAAASSSDTNFADLGGDSMAAYELATQLSDLFDLEVPATIILSPANGLQQVATYIENQRAGSTTQVTASTIHGDRTRILASELTLDKFLSAEHLATAKTLPRAEGAPVFLLTGANGYLGRFLALDLLKRARKTAGRVICLVRGTDNSQARHRLTTAMSGGDRALSELYLRLAPDHLEVITGDISQPRLGLGEETWTRLATEVTDIVHPGALVNHVLPYQQLFGPNVAGTAELIKLATTNSIKHLTYLSTVGIADQISPREFDEASDVRTMSPARIVADQYANGYANTKWASEVLLREAYDHCAVPVTVFRSNMILAHSRYIGQLNQPDMFTRLIFSILITGIAPDSFYPPAADGTRRRGHFDGLPVDFTANAIAELSVGSGHRTYNVVNPNDDEISLDTFIDWLVEAGHPIRRIRDYSDWVRRLEIGLRQLPDDIGQHSLLPLLHAFREPGQLPEINAPAPDFTAAITESDVAGGIIPSVQPALIKKYAADLRHRGLLGVPGTR